MVLTRPEDPVTIAMKALFDPHMDPIEDLQDFGFTAIHQIVLGLVRLNLEDQLRLTTQGIDDGCSNGRTPLIWAVMRGDIEAAKILLNYGAKMDVMDSNYRNVFHYVVQFDSDVLELLLHTAYSRARELQPSPSVEVAKSPVHRDIHHEPVIAIEEVTKMLDAFEGAEIDPSPLILAIFYNKIEHVRLLLEHGANPDLPKEVSRRRICSAPILLAAEFDAPEILALLLEKGAKRCVVDEDNMGLLHLTAQVGGRKIIQVLSEAHLCCLDTTALDRYHRTALQAFDARRAEMRPLDSEETRERDRKAFLNLLENIKTSDSDHFCTDDGFKPGSVYMADSDSDDEQFFEASEFPRGV